MYLALRPPWGHGGTTPPADGGVVAVATPDAGVGKPKKKTRHHRPSGPAGAGGPATSGDEQGWGSGDYVEETEPQLVQVTAADRAMEWRGDDTTRPPQKIDMNGAETRSLDDGEIRSAIDSQSSAAQQCVMQAATNTNLAGTISVKLVVDGTGHVIKAKVQAFHYMFEHGLLACMQRAVKGIKFASTGASTLVTMPINFN
jgi:hypothetical protein